MHYLIIDLEATCWEHNKTLTGQTIVDPPMETIEIGAVLCDKNGDTVSEFQTFVQPILSPILSKFCKELTHITQEEVNAAPFFKSAIINMLAWLGDKPYTFCSWGYWDKKQLIEDCTRHGITFPLGDRHINLKNEYARIKGLKRHGIFNTVKNLGWKWDGRLHSGISDARNMARVLKLIVKELNDAK